MRPCLCTFRDENSVIHALCLVYVDDFMLACSDSLHLENMSLVALTICTRGVSGSHECSNSAVHNTPEHGANLRSVSQNTRKRFPSSSHRRRDRKSLITPLETSQLRALNGQLLWLGMQCVPQLLALLSLLMGQTPQATVDTIFEVSKMTWKATAWA